MSVDFDLDAAYCSGTPGELSARDVDFLRANKPDRYQARVARTLSDLRTGRYFRRVIEYTEPAPGQRPTSLFMESFVTNVHAGETIARKLCDLQVVPVDCRAWLKADSPNGKDSLLIDKSSIVTRPISSPTGPSQLLRALLYSAELNGIEDFGDAAPIYLDDEEAAAFYQVTGSVEYFDPRLGIDHFGYHFVNVDRRFND